MEKPFPLFPGAAAPREGAQAPDQTPLLGSFYLQKRLSQSWWATGRDNGAVVKSSGLGQVRHKAYNQQILGYISAPSNL